MRTETTIASSTSKPRVAVHKFTSCDGCQLAFLNAGENLLALSELVEFVHFAELGPIASDAQVDIAFIEGSISTPDEASRIKKIRENARYLICIGACATSGGLQALKNDQDAQQWLADVYATPEVLDSLDSASPVSNYVRVDLELWGCPVNQHQVFTAIRELLFGVTPRQDNESVCVECKRQQQICVMVAQGIPCLGPVTKTGCGAICPRHGRGCYGCYGPSENQQNEVLVNHMSGIGMSKHDIAGQFEFINSQEPGNKQVIDYINELKGPRHD